MAESENIEVTVKTLDSQSRSYTVPAEITVKEFKERISGSVNIPAEKQRLIYQGRVLQDDKRLKEYNVHGKVIHLVERAPPQTTQPQSGGGASPSQPTAGGRGSGPTPHDRNANSYVMVGTFNLPVNLMDTQQIQQSVQQAMANLGETGRNARVMTTTGSEPRVRLVLAQHMLRDVQGIISRLEGRPNGQQQEAEGSTPASQNPPAEELPLLSSTPPAEAPEMMDTSSPEAQAAAGGSSPGESAATSGEGQTAEATSAGASAPQRDGAPSGPNHPSPSEYLEVLSELQRVEGRLQPFLQRYQEILGTATNADYNNNTEGRDEDQRIINLVGEALRLLGNTFVGLSDLRCNLSSATPRHLYVVRPMSHYTSPMVLQQAPIPIQINVGTTVTMTANGSHAAQGAASTEGQPGAGQSAQPPTSDTAQGATESPETASTQTQSQGSQTGHPRVVRITHQTVDPMVTMQVNVQDSGSPSSGVGSTGPSGMPAGLGGIPPIQVPGLPPEIMQGIVHQITQQAMSAAASASTGREMPGFQPQPPRVLITRAPGSTTRVSHIGISPQQGPQGGAPGSNASLAQMISGLVGQLLMHPVVAQSSGTATSTSSSTAGVTTSTTASTAPMGTEQTTTPTPNASGVLPPVAPQAPMAAPDAQFSQLLGNILGAASSGVAGVAGMPSSTITVAMPGVPAFIQGVAEFLQAAQGSTVPQQTAPLPEQQAPPPPQAPPPRAAAPRPQSAPSPVGSRPPGGAETLTPEFFTSVVQGVLSSMMGSLNAQQGSTESIADFIQRLSGTSNIFEPGADGALGFFGDLLSLICQNFSMVDMVMLLHGQFQPLQRIQPQLNRFFREQYLNNQDPTEQNIRVRSRFNIYLNNQDPTEQNIRRATDNLINGLEEYIRESFASVGVEEGVDITHTNLEFLREQFNRIATHILNCTDNTFGHRLLTLCNQSLFECLALNLFCLRGEQSALTNVINDRIRRMSADVNPSLVNWLTTMMGMRLQVILEHMPMTEEQIQHYVRRQADRQQEVQEEPMEQQILEQDAEEMQRESSSGSPVPATTAEEVMPSAEQPVSMETERAQQREEPDSEPWAATVPPDWVPIIKQDIQSQRKMKPQGPLSDAYLSGMPAKRRKSEGPHLSLSEAVNRAARVAGVRPASSPESLNVELERPELQDTYREQVKSDIQKRIRDDPNYSSQRFPNTHRAFEEES
ncbi:large proline-rich protein BAG6 isoform X2 [Latimeria chalumnae]|uniref:large proline-rich protein BAG6 isoform X2 n=1 Tax=Latimeria chalumnae TaxID=7897 RepID=UPI00313B9F88